jgi:uncharacterized membrane protein YqjE
MIMEAGPAPLENAEAPSKDGINPVIGLLESRAAIVSIEVREAISSGLAKGLLLIAALLGVIGAWALAIAGAISGLSSATGWVWFHIAFAAAGVHILIAAAALLIAKSWKTETFPVTRAEFEKDREWLKRLRKPNNSPS